MTHIIERVGSLVTSFIPLLLIVSFTSNAHAADETRPGWSDETTAGIVITGGNASSQSYSLRQLNRYLWGANTLRIDGRYLETTSRDIESARNWLVGLRYERAIVGDLGFFAGENLESDLFAGFLQRYNSDVGAKYFILKQPDRYLSVEAGYRYTVENRFTGQLNQSFLRFFAESGRDWTPTFSSRATVEFLPDLTIASDYLLNVELSITAALNETFALRVAYLDKFRNIPIPPATQQVDSQFTTSIVAKL